MMDQEVSTETVEVWKRIIAELALKAPNDIIKGCIKTYDPEKPTQQNIKLLKACRKDTITQTLEFLSKSSVADSKKEDMIDKLCLKIKNFFPETCQICDISYSVKLEDKPFLKCGSCGQEVHRQCYLKLLKKINLIDENEELREILCKIPGIFYLCPSCQEETISFPHTPSINLTVEDQPIPIKETSTKLLNTNKSLNRTPRILPKLPLAVTPVVHQLHTPKLSDQPLGRTEFIKNKLQREEDNRSPLISENTTDNDSNKKKSDEHSGQQNEQICRFYRKGKCKHGIRGRKCHYKHPKACPKLMKHGNKGPKGCDAGSKCPMYHPRMCASSIKQGQCFNEACTFVHIKGTRRIPLEDKTQSNYKSEPEVFLKILDNFKTEMVTMINEKMKITIPNFQQTHAFPHILNQPSQGITRYQPHQTNLHRPLHYQETHFQNQHPRITE